VSRSELHSAIVTQFENWARLGHPALIERFVSKHGRDMSPRAKHGYEMGTPKECFCNAAQMALVTDLTYAEGFAVRPKLGMLIHHAWLMDERGRAVDVTWEDTAGCLYFGVPFETKVMRTEIRRTGYWGLLDSGKGVNIEFMQRFDPAFEIPEMVRHLFPATA
jgi:hypothetical protein